MKMEEQPKTEQNSSILTDKEALRMIKRFSEGDLQALRNAILEKRNRGEELNILESACQEMDNEEKREDRNDWSRGF